MSDDVAYLAWLILSFVCGVYLSRISLFFFYQNQISYIHRVHNEIHRAQGKQIDELCRVIGESRKINKTGNSVIL